jgi:hypothetical protein
MNESKPIDINVLLKKAQDSEHKEAYKPLDRNPSFRIGVGVRLTPPNSPSFFVEILIYLCSSSSAPDLKLLENSLICLKELQARNYTLTCQDDNCISCETAVPVQNLTEEYAAVKSLIKAHFG